MSTAYKCGSTWTQSLCALLVFQSETWPAPLATLSSWVDRRGESVQTMLARYEAQDHRRLIKTHTPLDGLPYDEHVSYVVCGRDPRDAFLSMLDHGQNLKEEALQTLVREAGLDGLPPLPRDPDEFFALWLTRGTEEWTCEGFPFGPFFHQFNSFWAYRHLHNVFFLHYADMLNDLRAEMQRLAHFLQVPLDETTCARLVDAASIEHFRHNASQYAPDTHLDNWKRDRDFFRKARCGEWKEVFSAEILSLYERVSGELLAPELKEWLEHGRQSGHGANAT
ncbi:MAG: sulfotransferase domain-containing protein [Proteobacteria bacterium]|nr:sulfotransferase domain-containing protein [Pseudomonadota bacterium]